MKGLKYILGCALFFIIHGVFAQCGVKDYYAFYYTPNFSESPTQWERIKLSFINLSDNNNWTLSYEYGLRGFEPNAGEGYEGNVSFTESLERQDVLLTDNIDHNKMYDLYVCGQFIGEFQDAHALLELTFDFNIQSNRLYFVPFKSIIEEEQNFPDFAPNYLDVDALIYDEQGSYMNCQFTVGSSVKTQDLVVFEKGINTEISFDILTGIDHGSVSVMPMGRTEESSSVLLNSQFQTAHIALDQMGQWNEVQFELAFENINSDEFIGGSFDFRFMDNSIHGWDDSSSSIDNLFIGAIGSRKEICRGASTTIYGQLVTNEGIYSNPLAGASGLDSLEYTTLKYHPPLFINKVSNLHYQSTGAWNSYSWYSCDSDELVFEGRDFYPEFDGSYYLMVSDDNCIEISECIDVNRAIGVEEASFKTELAVYPNPTNGILNIVNDQNLALDIHVIDGYGRSIYRPQIDNSEIIQLNLSELASGYYLIQVQHQGTIIGQSTVVLY